MENRQQTHLPNLVSHTHNNAAKMVQVTARAGVYKRMEGKEKRLSDPQTHVNAHREGAGAQKEAQQEGKRTATLFLDTVPVCSLIRPFQLQKDSSWMFGSPNLRQSACFDNSTDKHSPQQM
jgi:hypothetical protein